MPIGVYPRSEKFRNQMSIILTKVWQNKHIGMTGKNHTEETKIKQKLAAERRYKDPLERAKIGATSKGRRCTEETRAKIGIALKGHFVSEETRAKIGAIHRGKHVSAETRAKHSARLKKKWQDPEERRNRSIIMKKLWQDPIFAKKVFANRKPNKAELILQDILNRNFPSEWKYVGDGQVNLGGRFPDFINVNGKKKVIELFGDYWHPMFDVAKTKEHYREYGFRVAILWEDELKDEARLMKVFRKKFLGGKLWLSRL